jgi:hypothetical protein
MLEPLNYEDLIKSAEGITEKVLFKSGADVGTNYHAGMHGALNQALRQVVCQHNLLLKLYNEKREEFNKLMESTR